MYRCDEMQRSLRMQKTSGPNTSAAFSVQPLHTDHLLPKGVCDSTAMPRATRTSNSHDAKTNSIENHPRADLQTRASSSIPGKFGRSPSNSRNCIKVNSRWVARQVRYEYVTLNRGHGFVSEHRRLDPHDRVTFNSALLSARFEPDPSRVRLFYARKRDDGESELAVAWAEAMRATTCT